MLAGGIELDSEERLELLAIQISLGQVKNGICELNARLSRIEILLENALAKIDYHNVQADCTESNNLSANSSRQLERPTKASKLPSNMKSRAQELNEKALKILQDYL